MQAQVTGLRYSDGKAIVASLHKGEAGLYCVDLTGMSPFSKAVAARERSSLASSRGSLSASTAASAESSVEELGAAPAGRMRFSEKHGSAGAAAGRLCHGSAFPPAPATRSSGADAGSSGAGFAAASTSPLSVDPALGQARHSRQAAVLGPRAVNMGPSVELFAPTRRSAQPASCAAARPASSTPLLPPSPAAGRASPSSSARGALRQRLSAEENAGHGHCNAGSKKAEDIVGKPGTAEALKLVPADQRLQPAVSSLGTMEDGGSHRGFLAEQMQRSGELRVALQAKQRSWQRVTAALQLGDVRRAVGLLQDAGGELGGGALLARLTLLQ